MSSSPGCPPGTPAPRVGCSRPRARSGARRASPSSASFSSRALEASFADGARPLIAYGDALASILPWQVACYVAAAALMLLLPRRAASPDNSSPVAEGFSLRGWGSRSSAFPLEEYSRSI